MKNIYILPTCKPSRLHYSKIKSNGQISYKLVLKKEFSKCNDGLLSGQRYIYITSDEEIKDNTWVLNIVNGVIYKTYSGINFNLDTEKERGRKIILTTDQDLIEDGVQAVDDEFLEWFVKNPSFESIEVIKEELTIKGEIDYFNYDNGKKININAGKYKIIIPKEKPKQETLEEAAEKYSENWEKITGLDYENTVPSEVNKLDFINGAKWQQEQEQNNENSWFNEYQEVEDYIIKRIGDKFLEATPEKYNTASEATIALLENNWEQDKNVYTEEQVKMLMFGFYYDMSHKMNVPKNLISENATNVDEWFKQYKKK